ncbi:putative protein, unknown function, partial [Plasmodium reichenowi]
EYKPTHLNYHMHHTLYEPNNFYDTTNEETQNFYNTTNEESHNFYNPTHEESHNFYYTTHDGCNVPLNYNNDYDYNYFENDNYNIKNVKDNLVKKVNDFMESDNLIANTFKGIAGGVTSLFGY